MLAILLLSSVFASAAPVHILIAYHSETGNTEKMAASVRDGAASVDGAAVTLRKVSDVTDQEIRDADGIVLGTPIQWGNFSVESKRFLDRVGAVLGKAGKTLRRGPDGRGLLHRGQSVERAGDGASGSHRGLPGDALRDRRRCE